MSLDPCVSNIHVIKTKTDFWAQDDAKICQTTTQVLVVLSDVKLENTNLHLYNQGVKGQNFLFYIPNPFFHNKKNVEKISFYKNF